MSSQKLISDNGWRFTIDSDSCFLTNKVLKKIGFVMGVRGLLLFEDLVDLCFTSVHQTTSSRDISSWDIHLLFH